jgi:autotransporter-associated beta strand protein
VGSNGTLSIGGSNVELSGNFSGSATLTKTGAGTLTLSGAASTFSGNLVISGGSGANSIVKAGSNSAFGTGTVRIMGNGSNTGSTFDLNGYSLDNALVVGMGNSGVADQGALINSNAGSAAVLNGAVSLGGEIYVGGAGDIRFNGVVSGGVNPSNAYSIYKDGSGTWTFANTANTFDGFYYQFNGTTEVASLGNLNQDSSLGRATDANRNRVVFGFNGNGGGTLRFIGSNSSTSDRVFSLSGSTAAASNTIEAAGTDATATLTLTGGLSAGRNAAYTARLAGNNTGTNIFGGAVSNGSGSVALEKAGGTTWALTGTNTYTGTTTVSSGTLKVGNGGSTGTLGSGAVAVGAGAVLAFDRSDTGLDVGSAISGAGTILQAGSGTTSLTGTNTYNGATTISAGTLGIGNGGSSGTLGSGTVSVGAGAAIAFNRSDSHAVSNTIGGAGSVSKLGAGTLTLSGNNTHSGGTNLSAGTLVVGGDAALGAGSVNFSAAGATLQTSRNISNAISVGSNGTLSIGGSNVELSGNFSGSATLTKTGAGTLTLSGAASTFSGNLVISGGSGANSIVKAGSNSAFGTGTVRIMGSGSNTGSTFDLNGYSLDNALVVGLGNSGVADQGALINSNAGSAAVLNGAVSLGGEIYVGGAGDIRFNGVVSGGVNPSNAYSIYKDGSGIWTFANTANTFDGFYYQFNGTTEVASLGNLNQDSSLGRATDANRNRVVFGFNGNGGGTLRFIGSNSSTSDRVFSLSGSTAAASNTIEAAGTDATATLTLTGALSAGRNAAYTARLAGNNTGANTYAGIISNGAGTVALEKTGAGAWTLSGANSYSGGTTVSGGRLAGTTTSLQGAIVNNAELEFAQPTNATHSTAISGSGTLIKSGAGTLTLAGSYSYSGGTVVSAGRLAGNATSLQGAFTNNAELEFAQNTAGTMSGIIGGSGSLIKTGTGNLTLSGANTYSGGTTVSAGRLIGTTTSLQGNIANNAALEFSQSADGTMAGDITGSGSFTKTGAGTVTLSGSNTYSGGTTVSAGKLVGTTTSLQGAIANNAAVEFSQSANGTYLGGISGSGSLAKSGAGTLTLAGNSTYTGATTVQAGQLTVDGAIASTATVQSGASIGGSGRVGGLILDSGATLAPGNSPGTLSVAGNATWNGGASLNWQALAANANSANQTAAGTGWDFIDIAGTLTLGVSTSNKFNINLWTLSATGPDVNGAIPDWDPNVGSTWLLASAANGITLNGSALSSNTDYSGLFNINTAATNGAGGWIGSLPQSFHVLTLANSNNLYLQAVANSAAIPEPGQIAASILLLAGIGAYVFLKRRKTAKAKTA